MECTCTRYIISRPLYLAHMHACTKGIAGVTDSYRGSNRDFGTQNRYNRFGNFAIQTALNLFEDPEKISKVIKSKKRWHFSKSLPAGGPCPRNPLLGESQTNTSRQIRRRDVIFQNPDPPETPAPKKSYLSSPKSHRNHLNKKDTLFFRKSWPAGGLCPRNPVLGESKCDRLLPK